MVRFFAKLIIDRWLKLNNILLIIVKTFAKHRVDSSDLGGSWYRVRAGERGVAGVAARLDTRLRLEADPRLEAGLDSGPVAELLDTDPHSSDRGGGRARRRLTRGSPILGALRKYYEDNVKTIVFGYPTCPLSTSRGRRRPCRCWPCAPWSPPPPRPPPAAAGSCQTGAL